MKEKMQERTITAAEQYFQRIDCEVLATSWEPADGHCEGHVDLVAKDGDAIVFVEATITKAYCEGFQEPRDSRHQREIMAAAWLAENMLEGDCPIRFDNLDFVFLTEDRALVRHHINALSVG